MKLPENKYGTHRLYPYKGAMHPGLARKMIEFCDPIYRDKLLDPFCGSGTIPVEAVMLGYDCTAIDVLPIAIMATFVKTHFAPGEEPDIDSQETGLQMVMSGKHRLEEAEADIKAAFAEMRDLVEKHDLRIGNCEVGLADSNKLNFDRQFDHIITSPPYGELIDYVEEATVPLLQLGFTKQQIDELRYKTSMLDITELAQAFRRALRPTGSVCLAVGKDQYGIDYPGRWCLALEDAGFTKHCGFTHRYEGTANQIPSEEVLHYVFS